MSLQVARASSASLAGILQTARFLIHGLARPDDTVLWCRALITRAAGVHRNVPASGLLLEGALEVTRLSRSSGSALAGACVNGMRFHGSDPEGSVRAGSGGATVTL